MYIIAMLRFKNVLSYDQLHRCHDLSFVNKKTGYQPDDRRFYIICEAFSHIKREVVKIRKYRSKLAIEFESWEYQKLSGREKANLKKEDLKRYFSPIVSTKQDFEIAIPMKFWTRWGATTKKPNIENKRFSLNYYKDVIDLLRKEKVFEVSVKAYCRFSNDRYLQSYRKFNELYNTNPTIRELVEKKFPPYDQHPTIYKIIDPILVKSYDTKGTFLPPGKFLQMINKKQLKNR